MHQDTGELRELLGVREWDKLQGEWEGRAIPVTRDEYQYLNTLPQQQRPAALRAKRSKAKRKAAKAARKLNRK